MNKVVSRIVFISFINSIFHHNGDALLKKEELLNGTILILITNRSNIIVNFSTLSTNVFCSVQTECIGTIITATLQIA